MTTESKTRPAPYALRARGFTLHLTHTVHEMMLAVRVRIVHSSGVTVTHMLDRADVKHSLLPFLLTLPRVTLPADLDTFDRLHLDAVTVPARDGKSAMSLTGFGPLAFQVHLGERTQTMVQHASAAIDTAAAKEITTWLAQWHVSATS